MTLHETFIAAERAWITAQDSSQEFMGDGLDTRLALFAAKEKAFWEWVNERSSSPIPAGETDLDPQPAVTSRLSGIVAIWSRERGFGTIAASDGTLVSFWKSGLTQSYIPGVGDNVTYRLGVNAGYGEVSECAVGVTCTDLPTPVKTNAQIKAREEAQKREDLIKSLAARREARQQKRMES